jgi:outer membrane immunogenic protein
MTSRPEPPYKVTSTVCQIPILHSGRFHMIRSILLGAASAIAIVASANAADLYKASPAGGYKDSGYVPADSWTGFYVGVNGGYGWSADDSKLAGSAYEFTCNNPSSNTRKEKGLNLANNWASCFAPQNVKTGYDQEGGFGGGQIGYNFQRDRLVFGIEADIQGSDISGDGKVSLLSGYANASASSKLDWFGTVRGRLGYSFERTLVYFTGGFAYGGTEDSLTVKAWDGLVSKKSKSETRTGYALGGGIEHLISPSWSLKAEYQYIDLGSDKISAQAGYCAFDLTSATLNAEHAYHTVRVGLNYHVAPSYEPLK